MSKIVDIVKIILEHHKNKGFQTFRTENYLIKADCNVSFDVSPYSNTYNNMYFLSVYPVRRGTIDESVIVHAYRDGTYLEYNNMIINCRENNQFSNPLSTDDMFHLSTLYDTSVLLDLVENFKYDRHEIFIYDSDMRNESSIEINLLHEELTEYANISGYNKVL